MQSYWDNVCRVHDLGDLCVLNTEKFTRGLDCDVYALNGRSLPRCVFFFLQEYQDVG